MSCLINVRSYNRSMYSIDDQSIELSCLFRLAKVSSLFFPDIKRVNYVRILIFYRTRAVIIIEPS